MTHNRNNLLIRPFNFSEQFIAQRGWHHSKENSQKEILFQVWADKAGAATEINRSSGFVFGCHHCVSNASGDSVVWSDALTVQQIWSASSDEGPLQWPDD